MNDIHFTDDEIITFCDAFDLANKTLWYNSMAWDEDYSEYNKFKESAVKKIKDYFDKKEKS